MRLVEDVILISEHFSCFNMANFFEALSLLAFLGISAASDPLTGLMQETKPCFDAVEVSCCEKDLSEVFSPTYRGPDVDAMDTQIWLFTSTNPDEGEPIHKCCGKLPDDTKFDLDADTVIITHGWLDGMCRTAWMREIKDQLLIRDKYNVILVDWTWGNAIDTASAAEVTGKQIGFVIINIMDRFPNYDSDHFHLIGHSYGSFVVNAAGNYVLKTDPDKMIGRITLLDPSVAPYAEGNPINVWNKRLAKFVDSIHGDGGKCLLVSFGESIQVGDVDFFPNGGAFQLSCYSSIVSSLLKGDLQSGLGSLVFPPLCSHFQTIQYFKVSINHPQGLFVGAQCNSYDDFISGKCKRCCKDDFSKCAVMGMDARKYYQQMEKPMRNRTYYLNLGLTCPYNEDYEFSIYKDC